MTDSLKAAICDSRRVSLTLTTGENLTVDPYMILRRFRDPVEILRGFIVERKKQCEVEMDDIKDCKLKQEYYAINPLCLDYDHRQYELIFPLPGDLDTCGEYPTTNYGF